MLAVTSVLMSFSVPGIPSGGLYVIVPFLAAAGLPVEVVGVLIALDLVPDVFKSLANVTGHLAAVTLLARGERDGRSVRCRAPGRGACAVLSRSLASHRQIGIPRSRHEPVRERRSDRS